MKKNLCIGILSLIAIPIIGQKVSIKSVIMGKNEITGKEIKGQSYSFGENITTFYIDSVQKTFTLHVVGMNKKRVQERKSQLMQYGWSENQIKWSKKFEDASMAVYEDCLFSFAHGECTRLDLKTGKQLWHSKSPLAFFDTAKKLAITCETEPDFIDKSYQLKGIDLQTGAKKWSTTLKFPFGIQFPPETFFQRDWNIPYLNDSTILVLADGVQTINLNTGTGWHYKVETGLKLDKNIETTVNGMNTGGIPLSFQRGARYVYPIDYKAITGLHSNLINDTTTKRLYFASKDLLTCLNYQGQEIWTSPFPQDYGSTSKLVLRDNSLYLVNKGSVYFNLSEINYGRAFVVAFNKTDGRKKWMTAFKEKDIIKDIIFKTNGLYILFNDKIGVCSLEDGDLFQTEKLIWSHLPSFSFFLSYPVTEKIAKNQYKSVDIMDTTKHYISTLNELVVLDKHFKLEKTIKTQDSYAQIQLSDYYFVTNMDKVLMYNKKNQLVAHLNALPYCYLMGSFYVLKDSDIIELKLKDILLD